MKLYVFLNEQDEIISQVRAENHDQAVAMTGLDRDTNFYSTSASENWEDLSEEEQSRRFDWMNDSGNV